MDWMLVTRSSPPAVVLCWKSLLAGQLTAYTPTDLAATCERSASTNACPDAAHTSRLGLASCEHHLDVGTRSSVGSGDAISAIGKDPAITEAAPKAPVTQRPVLFSMLVCRTAIARCDNLGMHSRALPARRTPSL